MKMMARERSIVRVLSVIKRSLDAGFVAFMAGDKAKFG